MSGPFVHGYGQNVSLLIFNSDPETNESFSAFWDPVEMHPHFCGVASETVWSGLETPHQPVFPQDLTDPWTTIRGKLSSRNVAGLFTGILFKRNKHVAHAFFVLEESLFVSTTLERLFKNSSSVWEVALITLPRLRSSGRSAGDAARGSFIPLIFQRAGGRREADV